MSNFRNKRLHLSGPEYITAIVVIVILLGSAFFYSKCAAVKDLYNIKKTSVDFIIQAPSQEQVDEISGLSHVDSIVPYIYRSIEINTGKKSVETNLCIIEKESDLGLTVFSDDLLIEKSDSKLTNPIYISELFSSTSGLGINDRLIADIDGNEVEFYISGIYGDDHRKVGGTIIAVLNDTVLSAMNGNYRYNSAYICSNSVEKTRDYLEDYQSLGDLRTREEFDSDDAYQIYLKGKNSGESESVFDREIYIDRVGKRNDMKLYRYTALTIICLITAIVVIFLAVGLRLSRYTKKNVGKDIRNNFTLKQEKQMYKSFCFADLILLVLTYVLSVIISYFVLTIPNIFILLAIGISVLVLIFLVDYCMANNKLNVEFAKQIKILEREKQLSQ